MRFISTRGKDSVINSAMAIAKGLADDGGLFVPERFPDLSKNIQDMLDMDYAERAALVLGSYLEEYDKEELVLKVETENGIVGLKMVDVAFIKDMGYDNEDE